MLTRRSVVLGAGSLATVGEGANALAKSALAVSPFVSVKGQHFMNGGVPYRYVGANMWYGAYLGAPGPTGNRDRLRRELDALAALGVTNLRVLGASESSPLRNSLRPAFRDSSNVYNEDLLAGLDFLLAEMGKRSLKAVIYLNNFWEWTGGMVTYLYWTNGGNYFDMNDPAHPWPDWADYSATFYQSVKANALYREYVAALIGRRNSITGVAYRDDPAIMAWQLANEPRPGGGVANAPPMEAFYAWVAATATFVHALDRNHLVSTGNEGLKGCMEQRDCVVRLNALAGVDYMTFHIWPLNWGWIDPTDMASTFPGCEANTKDYIASHLEIAASLNKPAVAEEFGFPRNGGEYGLAVPTTYRDRYYKVVFEAVEASARAHGPFAGTNLWAWGGEGRAQRADFTMSASDISFVGDPPQEPQGRNSVFDTDRSTLEIARAHALALNGLETGRI